MDVQTLVVSRMAAFVGEAEAQKTLAECLQRKALRAVDTPDAMMALADCLMRRGGVAGLVGRTLRAHALEAGAPLSP